jgi:nucleotide-binding universal stress UspA family protein
MKTILVCYEERPVAPRVLERAAELAKALPADVVVTSVAPALHNLRVGPADPVDPPARHQDELDEAVARLGELGVAHVEAVVGEGDPARVIVDLADDRQADMIVLGAHDGGLLSRVFERAIDDVVSHRAHTDVLIVH